jgi:hypothetical protein
MCRDSIFKNQETERVNQILVAAEGVGGRRENIQTVTQ